MSARCPTILHPLLAQGARWAGSLAALAFHAEVDFTILMRRVIRPLAAGQIARTQRPAAKPAPVSSSEPKPVKLPIIHSSPSGAATAPVAPVASIFPQTTRKQLIAAHECHPTSPLQSRHVWVVYRLLVSSVSGIINPRFSSGSTCTRHQHHG